jgi:CHAD domain-containing protein
MGREAEAVIMARRGRLVWNTSYTEQENASRKLPQLAREYFQAGRILFSGTPDPRSLHKFRLRTKRFRYTLELFQPCYGPGLEERLRLVRNIQDLLGKINDCATTQKLAGQSRGTFHRFLERRMALKQRELFHYWFQVFAAAGREEWWAHYLARFVRKPRRTS